MLIDILTVPASWANRIELLSWRIYDVKFTYTNIEVNLLPLSHYHTLNVEARSSITMCAVFIQIK